MKEPLRRALAAYEPQSHDRPGAREAAVLLLLYERDDGVHLLFQRRSQRVLHHKGEISFPGGARDPGDTGPHHTALRETHEETGVDPAHVDLLGRIDDVVTTSNYRVSPFVGWLDRWPYPFRYHEREVAELLEIGVAHLHDPASFVEDRRVLGGRDVVLPSYRYGEHLIWGATARMLTNFLDVWRIARGAQQGGGA